MKTKRSILTMVLALLLCASLAVSVSAATKTAPADIYIIIKGVVEPDGSRSWVPSTTSVKTNPDSAILYIDADFSNGSYYCYSHSGSSARGATSFPRPLPIYDDDMTGVVPTQVYTTHGVKQGSQAPNGYACYMLTSI